MICFWHNNALCLRPEDDKELDALSVVYYAFREGLKPRPEEDQGTRTIQSKYEEGAKRP
jgi:hypothetical protein